MAKPIFTSKITKKEVIMNFGIFLFVVIAFYFRNLNDTVDSKYFAAFLILLFFIWTITRFKTFILHEDRLIMRYTFLTSKFDKVYFINKIDHLLFYYQTGKFGGNKMVVYTIFVGDYDSYSIKLNASDLDLFIEKFKSIGVKVENKIID
jgi:hypothetical protein